MQDSDFKTENQEDAQFDHLKPCECCNRCPEIRELIYKTYKSGRKNIHSYVVCMNCGRRTRNRKSRESAIAEWNQFLEKKYEKWKCGSVISIKKDGRGVL